MISKLLVKNKFKKNYFSKALSSQTKNIVLNLDQKAWSYYNLGMYKTTASFSNEGLQCKGLVAKTISLVACGEFQEAKKTLEYLKKNFDCKNFYVMLANALAPFMPKTALSLLNGVETPLTLLVALQLKLGKTKEAYELLDAAIQHKQYRTSPELLLYFCNAFENISPQQQLTLVNKYLLAFQLPKLVLKDKAQALNTLNMKCHTLPSSSGPLVTIIMTTYKTGHRADVAITSVLNQTYKNIELIVVDDASGDATTDVVKEWMQKDSRARLIELPQNVGTYIAKNIALLQAKGKFVTCHDSDDWSHPLKIEKQVKPLLRNFRLVATISSWVRLSDTGEFYARPVHPLMRQNPSSLMFRKDKVLKHAGLWDCVRTGADSEFIARLRLVFGRKKIQRIKEPLSFGAHREDSLMTAQDTGYCNLGMSPTRLDYWEAWGGWHVEQLGYKRKPFVSTDLLAKRKFNAPQSIVVSQEDIKRVLLSF